MEDAPMEDASMEAKKVEAEKEAAREAKRDEAREATRVHQVESEIATIREELLDLARHRVSCPVELSHLRRFAVAIVIVKTSAQLRRECSGLYIHEALMIVLLGCRLKRSTSLELPSFQAIRM